MTPLESLQSWLRAEGCDGIVVPSADVFLSEFPPPSERRLGWLSGFTGSTGIAIVTPNAAALFLDGRYYNQGLEETCGSAFEVHPVGWDQRRNWLQNHLQTGDQLQIDLRLHSILDSRQWFDQCARAGIRAKFVDKHPIDELWCEARAPRFDPDIQDYPTCFAGIPREAKLDGIARDLKIEGWAGLLVADPEDVSWLLNVRGSPESIAVDAGEWHIVPAARSRLLVYADGTVEWFVDEERLDSELRSALPDQVSICRPSRLPERLTSCEADGPVAANLRTTPAVLGGAEPHRTRMRDSELVARLRWVKNSVEIEGARKAHIEDAVAVIRLMAELATGKFASANEFDVAMCIERYRRENPLYVGPSMPAMSAAGLSGAQAHYVPKRVGSRKLSDHPIYWLDSGGQYFGGTTDNTVTLALGAPSRAHVETHTLVTRGFIALTTICCPMGMTGCHLYATARHPLWNEGLDFGHGTGHGVGNFLNIHEGPTISRDPSPLSAIPIEAGVIMSNEPGFYAAGDFGMRIESHMLVVPADHDGFLAFATISRLPIDPKLVDFSMLLPAERQWLADYHKVVLADVGPRLDAFSRHWLEELVQCFVANSPGTSIQAGF
ncbi:MAG: M24 family metallopeptidase [Sphingomonadales bacterium]